jgi:hypothetical protein
MAQGWTRDGGPWLEDGIVCGDRNAERLLRFGGAKTLDGVTEKHRPDNYQIAQSSLILDRFRLFTDPVVDQPRVRPFLPGGLRSAVGIGE